MSDRTVCEHYKQGYCEECQAEADAWDRHQADLNMTIVEQYVQIDSITKQVEELKEEVRKRSNVRQEIVDHWTDLEQQLEDSQRLASQIVTDWIPANQMLAKQLAEAKIEIYNLKLQVQCDQVMFDRGKASADAALESKLQIAVEALEETLKAHHPNYGVCHAIALETLGKIRGGG